MHLILTRNIHKIGKRGKIEDPASPQELTRTRFSNDIESFFSLGPHYFSAFTSFSFSLVTVDLCLFNP